MASRLEENKVANRYAKVLFEVALENQAQDGNVLSTLEHDLQAIAHLFSTVDEFERFFASPEITEAEKRQFLEERIKGNVHPLVYNLMVTLVENDRFFAVGQLAEAYARILEEYRNVARAEVTTAIPMPENLANQLRNALAQRFGFNEIELETRVDPEIIGGVIVKLNDRVIDGSYRGHLASLREKVGGRR